MDCEVADGELDHDGKDNYGQMKDTDQVLMILAGRGLQPKYHYPDGLVDKYYNAQDIWEADVNENNNNKETKGQEITSIGKILLLYRLQRRKHQKRFSRTSTISLAFLSNVQ